MRLSLEFVKAPEQIRPEDLLSITRLLTQLHSRPCEMARSHLEAMLPGNRFLVARDLEAGGKLIGMAFLACFLTPTGKNGRIEDVVVEEAYRGQKIGLRLMETLLAAAQEEGLSQVNLTSNPRRVAANQLYRRLGFQKIETNVYRKTIR